MLALRKIIPLIISSDFLKVGTAFFTSVSQPRTQQSLNIYWTDSTERKRRFGDTYFLTSDSLKGLHSGTPMTGLVEVKLLVKVIFNQSENTIHGYIFIRRHLLCAKHSEQLHNYTQRFLSSSKEMETLIIFRKLKITSLLAFLIGRTWKKSSFPFSWLKNVLIISLP